MWFINGQPLIIWGLGPRKNLQTKNRLVKVHTICKLDTEHLLSICHMGHSVLVCLKKDDDAYWLVNFGFSTTDHSHSVLFVEKSLAIRTAWIFQLYYYQDSLDQCPMPIKILALIPMSINANQLQSIAINVNQCQIKQNWSDIDVLLMPWSGIDRNWEELIGIERHFGSMPWFWYALIGIGHWLRESCIIWVRNLYPINLSAVQNNILW